MGNVKGEGEFGRLWGGKVRGECLSHLRGGGEERKWRGDYSGRKGEGKNV